MARCARRALPGRCLAAAPASSPELLRSPTCTRCATAGMSSLPADSPTKECKMDNHMLRCVALLAGAGAAALALAAPASGQTRTTVFDQRFDGDFATATFDSATSACLQTSISV